MSWLPELISKGPFHRCTLEDGKGKKTHTMEAEEGEKRHRKGRKFLPARIYCEGERSFIPHGSGGKSVLLRQAKERRALPSSPYPFDFGPSQSEWKRQIRLSERFIRTNHITKTIRQRNGAEDRCKICFLLPFRDRKRAAK